MKEGENRFLVDNKQSDTHTHIQRIKQLENKQGYVRAEENLKK